MNVEFCQADNTIDIIPEKSDFYLSLSMLQDKESQTKPGFYLSLPLDVAKELQDKLSKVIEETEVKI